MKTSALDLRPSTWSEVVGQASTVKSLQNLLTGELPRAIGFSGPTGCGKTTLARLVATTVQPAFNPETDIINASVRNKVDDARALIEEARYRPLTGRVKVIILDEAHRMTEDAQNALLIPFEADVSSTLWMICTTEPHKIKAALKARCVWYDLDDFGEADIRELYERASVQNMDNFPEELFQEVLRKGLTNPRELLYALDKLNTGCTVAEAVRADGREIEYFEIAKASLTGWKQTSLLLKQLKASDAKPLKVSLATYMRSVLVNSSDSRSAQAASELLVRLAGQNAFEDSVCLAATCATLYLFTQKRQ